MSRMRGGGHPLYSHPLHITVLPPLLQPHHFCPYKRLPPRQWLMTLRHYTNRKADEYRHATGEARREWDEVDAVLDELKAERERSV
jgi:hypothetical protein